MCRLPWCTPYTRRSLLLPARPAHPHPACRPFQIKLKEIFETPSEIALVLELVTGGELFDRYAQPRHPPPGS